MVSKDHGVHNDDDDDDRPVSVLAMIIGEKLKKSSQINPSV